MNIKKTIVALAIAMTVAFVASVGMTAVAQLQLPAKVPLYADQNITVGNVTVENVSGNITITYNTTGGWVLNATHLHVDNTSLAGIPQTKKNNPIPGHFEYSAEGLSPATEWNTTIRVTENCTLWIAAQAEVLLLNATGHVLQEESAWAGTEIGVLPFAGSNWATYFNVTVVV